jgi:hypothetical protein
MTGATCATCARGVCAAGRRMFTGACPLPGRYRGALAPPGLPARGRVGTARRPRPACTPHAGCVPSTAPRRNAPRSQAMEPGEGHEDAAGNAAVVSRRRPRRRASRGRRSKQLRALQQHAGGGGSRRCGRQEAAGPRSTAGRSAAQACRAMPPRLRPAVRAAPTGPAPRLPPPPGASSSSRTPSRGRRWRRRRPRARTSCRPSRIRRAAPWSRCAPGAPAGRGRRGPAAARAPCQLRPRSGIEAPAAVRPQTAAPAQRLRAAGNTGHVPGRG